MRIHPFFATVVMVLLSTLFATSAHALVLVRMETVLGDIDIELYDDVAPLTVANFLDYANSEAYDGTFVHRSVPGFVVQGGGYALNGDVPESIPRNDPVPNEYNISNTRGTIAMAKLGGDPDSATSEWFFNLADNSANLDTQNGGFTVFGRVLGDGMQVVDAIAALQVVNAGGTFSQLPVRDYSGGVLDVNHYVLVNRILMPRELLVLTDLDFGSVGIEDQAELEVTVLNQGINSVTLGAIGALDPVEAPFSIEADACSSQVLASGESCVIRIGFRPTMLGLSEDSFNIPSNAAETPNLYVQLRGTGSLPLITSPDELLPMGGVVVGETTQETLSISNVGGISATITAVSITGPAETEFSQTHDCANLGPGESCQVAVTFAPVSIEDKQATLLIETDYVGQPLIEVSLTGAGLDVPKPSLGVSSMNLAFGDRMLGDPKTIQLNMINGGGADLLVSALTIEGVNADEFSVSQNCIGAMEPSQICSEYVVFTPASAGEKSASLVIASNDPDFPAAEVELNGFGRDAWNRIEVAAPDDGAVVFLSILGTVLFDVSAAENLSGEGLPEEVSLEKGVYEFRLGLPTGIGRTMVVISFPADKVPDTYYKYGKTPDNATPHWYEFMWDDESETGAVIEGNVVTLYFVDGARGDDDLAVNGLIVDPGGPGYLVVTSTPPPVDTDSSGGGGGCVMTQRPQSPAVAFDWLLLMGGIALLGMRRHIRLFGWNALQARDTQ
jgi:cyclophilin family peptidyl-prolyl cis-trans isomerase